MSTDNVIFQLEVTASSLVTNPVLIQGSLFCLTTLIIFRHYVDYVSAINELRGRGER